VPINCNVHSTRWRNYIAYKLDNSRQYIMQDHCLQIWNTETNKSPDMSVC